MNVLVYFNLLAFHIIVAAENDDSPKIVQGPVDMKVLENSVVSFFCKATGHPPPDISWHRGGKKIGASHTRYTNINMPQGSVLRINSVKSRRDDVSFECVAHNSNGETAKASAELEVYSEGNVPYGFPRIVENPTLKAVEKNRTVKLLCSATGYPEPSITWLKDFIPVDTSDPRFQILSTGTLQIQNSLESDEGKYECVAENSVGVTYSYPANLYVRVRRVAPHFHMPPEDIEVRPGDSVNLTCVAIGSPMPNVRWRLGALELTPNDSVPVGKNVLALNNITESATYTCVAASELGNIETEAEVKVKDMPEPPAGLHSTQVTDNSVKLGWQAVEEPVESFVIQFRKKYVPSVSFDEVSDVHGLEYTVSGLDAYTAYEFQVLAVNRITRGNPSESLTIWTEEGLPTSAPQNFTAIGLNPSTVRLQWDPPLRRHRNGEIVLYEVMYYKQHDSRGKITMNTTMSSIVIDDLEATTDFIYQIRAYTSIGPGPWSNRLPFRTFLHASLTGPTNVHVERMSPTSIEVTWDPPPFSGIVGYRIFYNTVATADMERWNSIETGPYTAVEIEGLEPHSAYVVRVRARASGGRQSNFSDIVFTNKTEHVLSAEPTFDSSQTNVTVVSGGLALLPCSIEKLGRHKVVWLDTNYMPVSYEDRRIIDDSRFSIVRRTTKDWHLEIRDVREDDRGQYRCTINTIPIKNKLINLFVEAPIESPGYSRTTSDTTLILMLYPASKFYGSVSHYYLFVIEDEMAENKSPDDFKLDDFLMENGRRDGQWIAARFDGMVPSEFELGRHSEGVKENSSIQNRPLELDRTYRVFLRVYTPDNKSTSSPFSQPLSTISGPRKRLPFLNDSMLPPVYIIALIVAAVVLVLLVVLIIIFIRKALK